MKAFKKLIPAMAMLLISLVVLSTASFAWFSMNKQVTATGMEVQAKSNATYLLIGDAKDVGTSASAIQAAALTTDAASNTGAGKMFYPANYTKTVIGENKVQANNWYTCNNALTSASTGNETNYKTLTEVSSTAADNGYATSDFANYVLANTFCLVLTADSEAWAGGLKITVAETDTLACVKTIVKVNDTYYEFATNGNVTINNIGISSSTVITVEVFTFIDGTTTNVYTDYAAKDNLKGSVQLTFDLVDNVLVP